MVDDKLKDKFNYIEYIFFFPKDLYCIQIFVAILQKLSSCFTGQSSNNNAHAQDRAFIS